MIKHCAFHSVAFVGRADKPVVAQTLLAVKDYLLAQGYDIYIEAATAEATGETHLPRVTADQLNKHVQLLLVIGGDGSLIQAAHMAVQQDLPVLGINRGRLGFLTDIAPTEFSKVTAVLQGHYQTEQRAMLLAKISHQGQPIAQQLALNDVVLLPGDIAHMIEFEIQINRQLMCKQRADGLIIATPTGSTAYALSGGGPILYPELEATVLVPMFPHNLSSRPIVVQNNAIIEIRISPENTTTPHVSCDGHSSIPIPTGGHIEILPFQKKLTLIHPIDYHYFQTLREKLGWQKANY